MYSSLVIPGEFKHGRYFTFKINALLIVKREMSPARLRPLPVSTMAGLRGVSDANDANRYIGNMLE